MDKTRTLLALLIIVLFLAGLGAIFYGLLLVSLSLAFVVLGIFLMGLSVIINQLIPSQKGGGKN